MKRVSVMVSLLALVFVAGAALAAPINVDFSVLGINSIDITVPSGYGLNGISFWYDNFGSTPDTAQVDSSGIFGSTYGCLVFDFDAPATALSFDFSLLGADESVPDALAIMLKDTSDGGSDVANLTAPATFTPYDPNDPLEDDGDALGTFSYTGASFNQALMFFAYDPTVTDPQLFTVGNISYGVPEPSGLAFLAVGLLGLPGLRIIRRRG